MKEGGYVSNKTLEGIGLFSDSRSYDPDGIWVGLHGSGCDCAGTAGRRFVCRADDTAAFGDSSAVPRSHSDIACDNIARNNIFQSQ